MIPYNPVNSLVYPYGDFNIVFQKTLCIMHPITDTFQSSQSTSLYKVVEGIYRLTKKIATKGFSIDLSNIGHHH